MDGDNQLTSSTIEMLHEIDSLVFHVSRNYTQWLPFSPALRLEMTGK